MDSICHNNGFTMPQQQIRFAVTIDSYLHNNKFAFP